MGKPYRIAILGIGGVGGYFGGKLAAQYSNSPEVEVSFIARGEHLKAIRENGLKLITAAGEQTIHPKAVTDDPSTLQPDLILCCVKNYDLESSLETLRPCVNENTVLISLLNGVDGPERMRAVFPQARVWEGFAYVISLIEAPGVVSDKGNFGKLFFGSAAALREEFERLLGIFIAAGIETYAPPDIFAAMWEKFHFISSIATLTSALDLPIGKILEDDTHRATLLQLLHEVKAVADAKGIALPANSVKLTLDKMIALPYETTSSMHRDFRRGKKTELESLTGYVVRQGNTLGVNVPAFETHYRELLGKLA